MSEHVHVVLLPVEGATVSRVLIVLKESVSKPTLLWVREQSPTLRSELAEIPWPAAPVSCAAPSYGRKRARPFISTGSKNGGRPSPCHSFASCST